MATVRPALNCPVKTVIKGDSRSLSIAAGSIMAKVTRDRMMATLAAEFPGYGWETNQGYGTAAHREGAQCGLGVTPHHRRSYAPHPGRFLRKFKIFYFPKCQHVAS